jgi:hypothetical protein
MLARRHFPDLIQLLPGIALGRDKETSPHTRFLAVKAISDVAGVVPQATPTAPFDGPSQEPGQRERGFQGAADTGVRSGPHIPR